MATHKLHFGIIPIIGIVGLVVSVLATSLLTAQQQISNTGIVKAVGVGVYEDLACTRNVISINWGALEPGALTSFLVYIKNEGNTPLILSMTTNDWNPAQASEYITLEWNREGHVLSAGSVVQANLTLSVSQSIEEIISFSFKIIIVGVEHL